MKKVIHSLSTGVNWMVKSYPQIFKDVDNCMFLI